MEPYSRALKFTVVSVVIGLFVTVLVASFPLPHFWAIISIVMIICGGSFVYFLPRISNKIGLRAPFFRRTAVNTTYEPPVVVWGRVDLTPWDELFRRTEREIIIQGITVESLNHVRTSIESAAKQGKRVRILLCHQETPFMTGIETLVVSTDTKSRIQSCVNMMYQTRDNLGSSDIQNLEIKSHKQIPTMSLVIVDDYMQIEPYPYKTPQDRRKTFRVNRKGQRELYDVYRRAFENLWNDAIPTKPNIGVGTG